MSKFSCLAVSISPYLLEAYKRRSILLYVSLGILGLSPSTNKPSTIFLAPGPAILVFLLFIINPLSTMVFTISLCIVNFSFLFFYLNMSKR